MSINSPSHEQATVEVSDEERFFNDPDAITDEAYWRHEVPSGEFRARVEERLRRNHPSLIAKYENNGASLFDDEDGDDESMLTAAWLSMAVLENGWRSSRRS